MRIAASETIAPSQRQIGIHKHMPFEITRINPHPPNVVQNHGTSYDATFIPAEILQQTKLLWRQLKHVIAAPCFTTHEIKLQIGGLQTR